jgi:hypothetical protein
MHLIQNSRRLSDSLARFLQTHASGTTTSESPDCDDTDRRGAEAPGRPVSQALRTPPKLPGLVPFEHAPALADKDPGVQGDGHPKTTCPMRARLPSTAVPSTKAPGPVPALRLRHHASDWTAAAASGGHIRGAAQADASVPSPAAHIGLVIRKVTWSPCHFDFKITANGGYPLHCKLPSRLKNSQPERKSPRLWPAYDPERQG